MPLKRLITVLLSSAAWLAAAEIPAPPNAAPGVHYVGSKVCAACHMPIYRAFLKTAMGRSASALPDSDSKLAPAAGVTIYNSDLKRYFRVFTKGQDIYQSEYALAADGSEIFRTTQKLAYGFGALQNGNTYAVQRGDRLFEAPLTYFVKPGKWAMSPGYQRQDSGFSRPIAAACAACHTSQPKPIAGAPDGTYAEPPFAELAIGCERCHGPGELHVRDKSSGHSGSDPLIVNPAKLPGWMSDNICMSCHENGAARIVYPGKTPLDFRPGMPLDDTVSIFAPLPANHEGTVDVLSHYQGMTASACYRMSGTMTCTTCHDPHTQPATAFDYQPKCLTCHTEASCKAPRAVRLATTPADNCMQCHMPRKPVTTIAHSALTDHRIIRQAGEPMPDLADAFAKQTGLLHLTAIPGQQNVSPEILFRGYTESLPSDPSLHQRWGELLQSLMRQGTDDPYVLAQAGSVLVQTNASSQEVEAGRKFLAMAVAAKVNLPGIYAVLAKTRVDSGDVPGAIAALQAGIANDPSDANAHRGLIYVYANAGQFANAVSTAKDYLQDFPQDTEIRALLPRLEQQVSK